VHSAHVPVNHVVFYYCCLFILFVVRPLFILLFNFCYHLIILLFIYSLFMFKEKNIYSDPGLYSRYFDPAVLLYKNIIIIYASQ
jgi:hypothetical protein